MADGFYTSDEPDIGCFGGYGSDGAWAYADDSGSELARPASGTYATCGDARPEISPDRRGGRFKSWFGAGSGDYGRAA